MDGIQTYAGTARPLVATLHPPGASPSAVKAPSDYLRAIRRRIWLVLAGADKASALGLSLADASVFEVPAAGVHGKRSTKFLVDQDAATEVPDELKTPDRFWTADDE